MNTEQRAALREAAEKATPGPWSALYDEVTSEDMITLAECYQENREADARYIALAHPAAVLSLLDEAERMREALLPLVHVAAEADAQNDQSAVAQWARKARAALSEEPRA